VTLCRWGAWFRTFRKTCGRNVLNYSPNGSILRPRRLESPPTETQIPLSIFFLPLARSSSLSVCACISICLCSRLHFHFLSVPHSFLSPCVAVETLFRPSEPYLLSISGLLSPILGLLQTHARARCQSVS